MFEYTIYFNPFVIIQSTPPSSPKLGGGGVDEGDGGGKMR